MKTVFITGANKGIGFETARQLAQKDYCVFLGSRTIENGIDAVSKLNNEGLQNIEAIEIDVSKKRSVEEAKNKVQKRIDKFDILIKYATLDENGPSGKYFSDDNNPVTGVSPW